MPQTNGVKIFAENHEVELLISPVDNHRAPGSLQRLICTPREKLGCIKKKEKVRLNEDFFR